MPLYAYQCEKCKATFEIQASFHEKDLGLMAICPNCNSTETRQVLTAGMFVHSTSTNQLPSNCGPNSGSGCCG